MNKDLEIILLINSKMSGLNKKNKSLNLKSKDQTQLYSKIMIMRKVPINITNIGNNIKETLQKAISNQNEGKCIVEGFIQPGTVEIITFSSGLIVNGSHITFEVIFQCNVCLPVEGMHIECIAKNINKMGIRAELQETPTPLVIFIARDHNYTSPLFSSISENDTIQIKVIGQRFELNDKYISVIAELIDNKTIKNVSSSETVQQPPSVQQPPPVQPPSVPQPPPVQPPSVIALPKKTTLKKKPRIIIKQ